MHPATMQPVKDCSEASVQKLIQLIECSSAPEHFLYREAELDDLWRQVQTRLEVARAEKAGDETRRLERQLQVVWDAHNLVADMKGPEAAARLSQMLTSK